MLEGWVILLATMALTCTDALNHLARNRAVHF